LTFPAFPVRLLVVSGNDSLDVVHLSVAEPLPRSFSQKAMHLSPPAVETRCSTFLFIVVNARSFSPSFCAPPMFLKTGRGVCVRRDFDPGLFVCIESSYHPKNLILPSQKWDFFFPLLLPSGNSAFCLPSITTFRKLRTVSTCLM